MGNRCCPEASRSDMGNFLTTSAAKNMENKPFIVLSGIEYHSLSKNIKTLDPSLLSTNHSPNSIEDKSNKNQNTNMNELKVLSHLHTQDHEHSSFEIEGSIGDFPSPDFAVSVDDSNNPTAISIDAKIKLGLYDYEDNTDRNNLSIPLSSYRLLATDQIYKGQWRNGRRQGCGELYEPDGSVYKGLWKNNKKEGKGKYIWSDGRVYTGEWRDDLMHGRGELILPNGSKYKGEFVNGVKSGFGEFEWPNKSKYVGPFKDDKMDGEGAYSSPDGKTRAVLWKNGERVRWF